MNHWHILNGDALLHQFPETLEGKQIVARECLITGDVQGEDLEAFFATRAIFIKSEFGESIETYDEIVKEEFLKLKVVGQDDEINLWFEDDLFCQVNFWFVCYLIHHFKLENKICLVRPELQNQFGFGGLSKDELVICFENRLTLSSVIPFVQLWKAYVKHDLSELLKIAKKNEEEYPFLLAAIQAHIDRFPEKGEGRPMQTLRKIIEEADDKSFPSVFKTFCAKESIYGFGDTQVKKFYDRIIDVYN